MDHSWLLSWVQRNETWLLNLLMYKWENTDDVPCTTNSIQSPYWVNITYSWGWCASLVQSTAVNHSFLAWQILSPLYLRFPFWASFFRDQWCSCLMLSDKSSSCKWFLLLSIRGPMFIWDRKIIDRKMYSRVKPLKSTRSQLCCYLASIFSISGRIKWKLFDHWRIIWEKRLPEVEWERRARSSIGEKIAREATSWSEDSGF